MILTWTSTIALCVLGALFCAIVVWHGFAAARKNLGIAGLVIAAGFLHSMATKPTGPIVQFDDFLRNDGTHYITNGVTKVGVNFRWAKTRQDLPNTQPLYISKQLTNDTTWVTVATTTVGASPYALTLANPDQYRFYLHHDWIPPSPVHTNGVWLGNIIEKAKGDNGLGKLLIINGELRQNGKVIAP